MRSELSEETVVKANSQFWEQMLAMTLQRMPIPDQFCVSPGHVLASVELAGVWTGQIEVRMADGLARSATAAMLMQPLEDVSEPDMLDATKEIANMIAGVIKSSLPPPCTMTVPSSVLEASGFCSPHRTEDSLVVAFRHESGDLIVRLWERSGVQH